jgi:hypothetical protein
MSTLCFEYGDISFSACLRSYGKDAYISKLLGILETQKAATSLLSIVISTIIALRKESGGDWSIIEATR